MEIMVDENKICFIICANNELFYEECVKYIRWLEVPDGMEVELMEIREASSMTGGYNEGMRSSNARYKVYMHQDVFIINKYFIYDITSIFKSNEKIGLIGLIGSIKVPESGVMWSGNRVGNWSKIIPWEGYRYDMEKDGWWEVEGVDGLLMATQYDIPWREDLFDGWDFYDLSQSFEMRKRGYRVVVPVHKRFWHLHDDKPALSLWNYNNYRRKFIKEYMENQENGEYDNCIDDSIQ